MTWAQRLKRVFHVDIETGRDPVTLDAKFNGGYAGHPLDPHARIGFSARGTLKRSEFGIAFGIPAPGSTLGVGDDVDVIVETEFSGPAWSAPPSQK